MRAKKHRPTRKKKNMKTRCYGHKGNKNEKLKTPTDFSKQKTQIFA